MSTCETLLRGVVLGFWSRLRKMRQGRARGENGEKAVRKEVIVWTGIVMVCCSLLFIIPSHVVNPSLLAMVVGLPIVKRNKDLVEILQKFLDRLAYQTAYY